MKVLRGKEVYIITGVVAVVLIVAWYFLLLSPKLREISDMEAQKVSAQDTLALVQSEVKELERQKKMAPQNRVEIVRLSKILPEAEDMPALMLELTKSAGLAGVDVGTISRGQAMSGQPYGTQTVTLAVSGRFFDLEDFLYRVENYVALRNASFRVTGRLFQVTQMSISGSQTTLANGAVAPLTVSLTVQGYLWGAPAAAAAASTAPAAGG